MSWIVVAGTTIAIAGGTAALTRIRRSVVAWPITIVLLGGSYEVITHTSLTHGQHFVATICWPIASTGGLLLGRLARKASQRRQGSAPQSRS